MNRLFFYKITALVLSLLFLPACLLTHKDIKPTHRQQEGEGKYSDDPSPKPLVKKRNLKTHLTEKISQLEAGLRELRGEMAHTNKEQENRLSQTEQGMLSLLQALDLRVTALSGEVEKLQKQAKASAHPAKADEAKDSAFHKAEVFFKEKKWKRAIIHYEKYRAQNKEGEFYKKATLQIGLCFLKLNLQKEAQVFFRELVQSFPKSEEAKEAKKLLPLPSAKKSVKKSNQPVKSKASVKKPVKEKSKKPVKEEQPQKPKKSLSPSSPLNHDKASS